MVHVSNKLIVAIDTEAFHVEIYLDNRILHCRKVVFRVNQVAVNVISREWVSVVRFDHLITGRYSDVGQARPVGDGNNTLVLVVSFKTNFNIMTRTFVIVLIILITVIIFYAVFFLLWKI